MRTLPMPQVLRAMGLTRRPDSARSDSSWTLNLTELSPSEAVAYQLSRHPAMGLPGRKPVSKATGPVRPTPRH